MPGDVGAIVGILLAGGSSTRFGTDKLLYPLPDRTPIAVASARRLLQACPHSISVLRPEQTELRKLLIDESVEVIVDRAPERGMGSSLAYAIRSSPDAQAWLIALADMPFLKVSTLHSVVEALRNGAEIAAPVYRGRRGHPVGFSKRWFTELSSLQGDGGARRLVENHPLAITFIDVDDPGIHRDIDTPDDLRMNSRNQDV